MKKLVKGLFVMGGFVCVGLGILAISLRLFCEGVDAIR